MFEVSIFIYEKFIFHFSKDGCVDKLGRFQSKKKKRFVTTELELIQSVTPLALYV